MIIRVTDARTGDYKGSATWWEILLTIVIMIVSIFVCAIIAARIYRYGVLMYGQKPSMRQLVKIARMN